MFVVDTNVLVYAADRRSAPHGGCKKLLESWRAQESAWYTTWGICYEFLRVATHPNVMKKPLTASQAWSFVESLLASPGIGLLVETDRHGDVLREVLGEVPFVAGNLFHDAHTAVLMREHGIRTIYTRDTAFHRFEFLDVRDPLKAVP